jgi:hypothetical protein
VRERVFTLLNGDGGSRNALDDERLIRESRLGHEWYEAVVQEERGQSVTVFSCFLVKAIFA